MKRLGTSGVMNKRLITFSIAGTSLFALLFAAAVPSLKKHRDDSNKSIAAEEKRRSVRAFLAEPPPASVSNYYKPVERQIAEDNEAAKKSFYDSIQVDPNCQIANVAKCMMRGDMNRGDCEAKSKENCEIIGSN